MKKTLLLSLLLSGFGQLFAQNADSVTMGSGSPSYPYDVYYNLSSHEKDTVPNTNWHLAFALRPALPPANTMQSTTIRANDGRNVNIYKTGKTVADWSTVTDTTGLSTMQVLTNSNTTWDIGAFNADFDNSNMFDYGWGQYNMSSHDVRGSKLFIISIGSGSNRVFRKAVINAILFDSLWDFTIAKLDGTDSSTQQISKRAYGPKLFVYYNVLTKTVVDREPNHPWDLLFTYYKDTATFPGFPTAVYPFMGVLQSPEISVGEVRGLPKATSDTAAVQKWDRNISSIGWDWKRVYFGPPPSGPYDLTDSLSYFIKRERDSSRVFKMYFTLFTNTPANNIVFNTEEILTHVGIAPTTFTNNDVVVYPNPASTVLNVEVKGSNNGKAIATLTDMTGKTILSSEMNSTSLTLNVTNVKPGVYFLSVATAKGSSVSRVIIQ